MLNKHIKRASYATAVYLAIIALAVFFNISFASPLANALLLVVGYMSFAMLLIVATFRLKPLWLGLAAGSLLSVGFATLFSFIYFGSIFYPWWRPDYEGEQNGLVCRAEYYGVSSDETRIEVRVFRPYFFGLEHRVSSEILDDVATTGSSSLHGCPPVIIHTEDGKAGQIQITR